MRPILLCALTPGMKLSDWADIGSLARELQPYRRYVEMGLHVRFLQCARGPWPALPPHMSVAVLPHWRVLLPLSILRWPQLRGVQALRTNQTYRADSLLRAATVMGVPSVLRCGYVAGEQLENIYGRSPRVRRIQAREGRAFRSAARVQVPTRALADWVSDRYGVSAGRLRIVPNFVDTDVFAPASTERPASTFRVGSVGRLERVKRFDLLLRGTAGLGAAVHIAGEGVRRGDLEALGRDLPVDLRLHGRLPHDELPRFYNSLDTFVISSTCEGHPKALLEAMACGVACVGVDVPGVRDAIADGVNGLLVPADEASLSAALERLREDKPLRARLGSAAREFAVRHFNKNDILRRDAAVIAEVCSGKAS